MLFLSSGKTEMTDIIEIGHCNLDHDISSKRWRLERFTTKLPKPDLDRLLNKALRAPSFGGGFVISITMPYTKISSLGRLYFRATSIGKILCLVHAYV